MRGTSCLSCGFCKLAVECTGSLSADAVGGEGDNEGQDDEADDTECPSHCTGVLEESWGKGLVDVIKER